jgi:outer membrane lipoprotein LolB
MIFFGNSYRRIARGLRSLSVLLGTLGLSACASFFPPAGEALPVQRDDLQDFALEARFSLRHEEKNFTGRLSWRHAGIRDDLLLASPFGQGMAEIASDETSVRLTTGDGKSYAAADIEMLTQQVLGFPLPLKKLLDWVRGRSSGSESDATDAFGRPLHVRQDGWRIDYEYDSDDPQALPGRLFVEREGVFELRLRIDEWNVVRDESGRP